VLTTHQQEIKLGLWTKSRDTLVPGLAQVFPCGRKKEDSEEIERYPQALRYLITLFSSQVIVIQSVEHIQDPAQPKGDTKARHNAEVQTSDVNWENIMIVHRSPLARQDKKDISLLTT
jgi:hypothetical protein